MNLKVNKNQKMEDNKVKNLEQVKELVNELVNNLKSKGIKAEVGVVDLGNVGKDITNQAIGEALKKVIGNLKKDSETNTTKEELSDFSKQAKEEDFECFCKQCAFKHFEEILKNDGGKFDYTQAFVGGKAFDIKYWTDGKTEHLVIDKHEEPKSFFEQFKELHELLNQAVQKGDFAEAQEILSKISQLEKTKRGN